jgi:cytochrome P450
MTVTTPTVSGDTSLAMRWESRIHRGAHPILYPFLRLLARIGDVVKVPKVGVVVSDATIAKRVITDTTAFSKAAPGSPADLWTPVLGPAVLLNMAGEEHARMRRQLSGLFVPGYVNRLCNEVMGPIAEELRADLEKGETVDIVQAVRRCAGAIIAGMVGVPADEARLDELFEQGTELTSLVRLYRRSLTAKQVVRAKAVVADLTAPVSVAYRAGSPDTVPGRMRELGMPEDQVRGTVAAFILVGTETLVSFLPRLIALTIDSGWMGAVADDPALYDSVVSEGLRVTVPSPIMLRGVVAEATVGRTKVRPGDRIVVATLSCAQAYGDFDPTRPHPPELRQLWFGAGEHFCLGMPLAMAEVRTVYGAVLDAWRSVGPLTITERKVAKRVLIPGYAQLKLSAAGSP